MKKIILIMSSLVITFVNLNGLIAHAIDIPEANKTVVVAQGLFTGNSVTMAVTCDDQAIKAMEESQASEDNEISLVEGEVSTNKVIKFILKLFNPALDGVKLFFKVASCEAKNLFMEIMKIATPVNITNNTIIMQLMKITQLMALSLSIVIIGAFSIMYAFNYENLNVVKFVLRLGLSMGLVYYLPYLIQDVLNINNMFVYYISNTSIGGNASGSIGTGLLVVAANVVSTMLTAAVASGGALIIVAGIAVLTIIINIVNQLLRLILWWYTRMLLIFLLSVLGPFFVIMLALPQTADFAEDWAEKLFGEIFQQLIFVIAIVFFVAIFMNLDSIRMSVDISQFGYIFLFYAGLTMFTNIPAIAKELIGGLSKGGSASGMGAAAAITALGGAAIKKAGNGALKKSGENALAKDSANQLAALKSGISKQMGGSSGGSGGGPSGSPGGGSGGSGGGISKNQLAVGGSAPKALGAPGGGSGGSGGNELVPGGGSGGSGGPEGNEFVPGGGSGGPDGGDSGSGLSQEAMENIANLVDNVNSRDEALEAMKQVGMDYGLSPEDAERGMEANLREYESAMGMSVDAQKSMENLAKENSLTDEAFDKIMKDDIMKNPDLHGVDVTKAGSVDDRIKEVKEAKGFDSGNLRNNEDQKDFINKTGVNSTVEVNTDKTGNISVGVATTGRRSVQNDNSSGSPSRSEKRNYKKVMDEVQNSKKGSNKKW